MSKTLSSALCVGLAVLVAIAGCQNEQDSKRNAAALPTASPTVVVELRDYRFDYDTPIPSGRVVFRVVNKGKVSHRPALLPLAEDIPPIKQQLRGKKRRTVSPFAGVHDRAPGKSGSFAVDLVPGRRYALVCFARDRDGSSHALKGMASEFRTTKAPPPLGAGKRRPDDQSTTGGGKP